MIPWQDHVLYAGRARHMPIFISMGESRRRERPLSSTEIDKRMADLRADAQGWFQEGWKAAEGYPYRHRGPAAQRARETLDEWKAWWR